MKNKRNRNKLTGAILAGGKSKRLQRNKAFLKINGSWILERQVRELEKVCNEILVVGNFGVLKPNISEVKFVNDMVCDIGPIGGIYSALKVAENKKVFVTGCDMPYINVNLIELLLNNLENYDVIVPVYNKLVEPLYAIFTKNCLNSIEKNLKERNLTLRSLFEEVNSKYFTLDEIADKFDLKKVFFNINTKEDLRKVLIYA